MKAEPLEDNQGPPSSRSLRAFPVLLVAVAVLVRFAGHLSPDAVVLGHDWYTMHSVDALHVQLAAHEGQLLPSWSPWVLGGSPLWGVSTKPFSYPPFLLAVWSLGAFAAMNVLLLMHAFVGGIGTMWLARRMNLADPAPLLCGLLFVLTRFPASGFVATPYGFGYAIAWWPFFLIAFLDLLERDSALSAGLRLGFFGALQWHAGGQASLYWLLCFCAVFALPFLARAWTRPTLLRSGGGVLLSLLVFLGLIAIKLLPELDWIESSGRGTALGMGFARDSALELELQRSAHGSRLLTLGQVLFEQYSGAGGLTLLLGSVLALVRFPRHRMFVATGLATAVVFVLASGAAHEWAYEWLPSYDRMRRHSRFVHMVGFGWILLAATGFQCNAKRPLARWATPGLVLLVLFDTSSLLQSRSPGHHLESSAEVRDLYAEMVAPVLADPQLGRMQESHRAQASWVQAGIEGSGGALGGPDSGNALYHEFLPEHAGSLATQRLAAGALDVLNVRYLISDVPDPGHSMEFVQRAGTLRPATYTRMKELGLEPMHVFLRKTARARICRVQAPTLVVGEQTANRKLIAQVMQAPGYRAWEQVFVECSEVDPGAMDASWATDFPSIFFVGVDADAPALSAWFERVGTGTLRADKRGAMWTATVPQKTEVRALDDSRYSQGMGNIRVDVQGLGIRQLLLADRTTLDRGWSATIDGVPATLLRADGLVTLLRLPQGARSVRLEYTPPGRTTGLWITSLTTILLLLGVLRLKQKQRPHPSRKRGEAAC